MAGLYIHVPFCRQACRYCDFFFTVSLKYREEYTRALLIELRKRKEELAGQKVSTIYLGGGTPSVLSREQLGKIISEVYKNYETSSDAEISVEANPDDLSEEYLQELKGCGINRLSIGIQSFREKDLELMRRSHSVQQAMHCVELTHKAGFRNITVDLIYGVPGLTLKDWENNILQAMKLPVGHLSAYHLTYEPGTVFSHWKKQGKIKEISEQLSIDQYQLLREITAEYGFEHYEISNFAREGFRSKHNSSYWDGSVYLGFGPSAHSYNGRERRWNVSSLSKYINGINQGHGIHESEVLTPRDKYHDYLITTLRTSDGLSKKNILASFGEAILSDLNEKINALEKDGELVLEGDRVKISPEGWLRSDHLISRLMLNDNFKPLQKD